MKPTLTVLAAAPLRTSVLAVAAAATAPTTRASAPKRAARFVHPVISPSESSEPQPNMRPDSGLLSHAAPGLSSPVAEDLRRFFGQLVGLVDRGAGLGDERRLEALRDRLLRDHALGDVLARRQLEHHVEQRGLDDRAEAAGARFALQRLFGDLPQRVLREDEFDRVVGEEALVLLRERVLRLGEDLDEVLLLQLVHRRDDGQAADELGDQPEAEEVLRHHLCEQLGCLDRPLRADLRAEADGVLADPLRDDLVEPRERAAATVPSRIFSSACWTPSPDTSRVIDGLSALRAILSTSSM